MKVNFAKFQGSLPYASELYGVYQPLLGWRSARLAERFGTTGPAMRRSLAAALTENMRPSYTVAPASAPAAAPALTIEPGAPVPSVASALPGSLDSVVTRELLARIKKADLADPAVWDRFVGPGPDGLAALLRIAEQRIAQGGVVVHAASDGPQAAAADSASLAAAQESRVAGTLKNLHAAGRYDVLHAMFSTSGHRVDVREVDALAGLLGGGPPASPGARGQAAAGTGLPEASLSPLGVVHLFRQYFFEFDSFLGPPVQHIWLSPGASVELIEVSTRRTLTERTTEASEETTQRSEQESRSEDELSASVSEENQSSSKFGVSLEASTSGKLGVFNTQATARTSYDSSEARKTAKEQTHKQLRQQTIKLSTEIKRSFKSTFKTVVETTDTSSKRYLLQNTTDKLVNYELRRKMRQVGVQVQEIGTQLCWQTYIDRPGDELGVAELVHVAQPPQGQVQPAQLVPMPEQYQETVEGTYKGPDDDYFNDALADLLLYPKYGYEYKSHTNVQWLSSNVAELQVSQFAAGSNRLRLRIIGHSGDDGEMFPYRFTVNYGPTSAYVEQVNKVNAERLKEVDQEKERLAKEAFFKAAQERVKLAAGIGPRRFEDLREEERIVVYRHLIRQLFKGKGLSGISSQTQHVMAELVQAFFDVDRMLYFVAPEWWVPNKLAVKENLGFEGSGTTEKEFEKSSVVGWGGTSNTGEDYYITADSRPARLGSSLGWLLQLDGDNLRNAFLNAPWVKAVVPIRQGHEFEALDWLANAGVEGTDGLDALYAESVPGERGRMLLVLRRHPWKDPELGARYRDLPAEALTVHDAVRYLAVVVGGDWQKSRTKVSDRLPDGTPVNYLPTDKVYERGFDPLGDGFQADGTEPFQVFDQWIEVMPTDQIVATEVRYDPKTGMQL
ncbi:hypothetical protein [Streptomyces lavendulae]|uniref:hypothetical protein n=1 Tax=Streptomyces lavendulae TaxID=1914 RepID=UPI0024A42854|nr:hypothetical protein [Streptomyces lavendulae]GLX17119.1 hypothetical protein Slala01_07630 [Streptomyces lavendulae subsp. lavendulae]GLX29626.1 hypothetical protein Slala02_54460 [Streptomyces lavendulae subsp. lavendulae]